MITLGRLVAYLILALTSLVGAVSLLLLMVFLLAGSLDLVDLGLGEAGRLAWDTLLCFAFFIQHSGMIRRSFRRRLDRFIPSHYQEAFYTVASGIVLLVLLIFWQQSAYTLINLQGSLHWLVRGISFLAIAGFAWSLAALGSFDAFGLNPILAQMRSKQESPMPFVIRGPYRWIRHPLYFFMLVLIWSCPRFSADRLLFNTLWTAWVVVGTVLEERDLVADFGEAYSNYQDEVPMLIPWRVPTTRRHHN